MEKPNIDNEYYQVAPGAYLNPELIKKQGLDAAAVKKLRELHWKKDEIMRRAHEQLRQVEFEMQNAWGFEEDESKHTWRHQVPNPPAMLRAKQES